VQFSGRNRPKNDWFGAALGVALLLLVLIGAAASIPGANAQSAALPDVPKVTAKAVFSIDVSAGVVLMAQNPDKELSPASTTKIFTALVVVNNANLDDPVIIDAQDTFQTGESTMGLVAGDTLTVEDLLYGLMLPSGNDAARSLARYVGGLLLVKDGAENGDPTARFVDEMNREVDSLGLKHSHFTNPDGLDQKGLYSSARDLATAAAALLQNKTLATIVGTPAKDVTSIGETPATYSLANTNVMLTDGSHPDVQGVKTGGTSVAGGCLVLATWAKGENHIITVVLGSDISYDASDKIVDGSDKRYEDTQTVLKALQQDYVWLNAEVPGLDAELAAWQVSLSTKAKVVVRKSAANDLKYLLQLGPAGKTNAQVGQVLFFIGSEQVAARPVVQLKTSGG